MPEGRWISVDRPEAWDEALACCGLWDCYHLAGYHRVAQQQGQGRPLLFCFEHRGQCAAFPLLVRPVAEVGGLEGFPWSEATSVYGYPGVVASVRQDDPCAEPFRRAFQAALDEALCELGVVAVFTRQNPLIDTSWLLCGAFETLALGPTVSIDLTRSESERLGDMGHGHRYEIRLAQRAGIVVREDPQFHRIGLFEAIYRQTMDRLHAAAEYYFPAEYYASLKRHLQDRVRLFFAEQDGQTLAGALFLLSERIVQYHLSGTAAESAGRRGAVKLLLAEVSQWAAQAGFARLHLGGGLGAREDRLYAFKAGFSSLRHTFHVARRIIDLNAYRQLSAARHQWLQQHGLECAPGDFFPEYRRQPTRRAA